MTRSAESHARNVAARKAQIVEAIERCWDEEGIGPTRAEIAYQVGLSLETVSKHVKALIEEGTLEERPGVARTLRLAL